MFRFASGPSRGMLGTLNMFSITDSPTSNYNNYRTTSWISMRLMDVIDLGTRYQSNQNPRENIVVCLRYMQPKLEHL
jgi:hypothetical protein